jgi:hypothetical protein
MDLLRTSGNPQGGGSTAPELPATVGRLSSFGTDHKCVMGEAVVIRYTELNNGAAAPATTPLSTGMTFSAVEKKLWGGFVKSFQPMTADANASLDDAIAICVDPIRGLFVVSGRAWVRVRRLRSWHRYARRCLSQPADTPTQLSAVAGCLDSCGWGPAEILGYAGPDFEPTISSELTNALGRDSFTPGAILWALVRF